MRDIELIFEEYKRRKVRVKDLEYLIRLCTDTERRARLLWDLDSQKGLITTVEEILQEMPTNERAVIYWRYQYKKGDWEAQAIYNEYACRRTIYNWLAKARVRFMSRWKQRQKEEAL